MPHEFTVRHEETEDGRPDRKLFLRSRSIVGHDGLPTIVEAAPPAGTAASKRKQSLVPHLKAVTPKTITHHFDVNVEDEKTSKMRTK